MSRKRQNPPSTGAPAPSESLGELREFVRRLWQTVREQAQIIDELEARIEVLEDDDNG